jgi:REP element-mobilizing transposase RayT
MARPIRIQYPGAQYHIISRGNGGNNIFRDKLDYQIFLKELKQAIEDHNWISYAYCLMPDHYYLYIKHLIPTSRSACVN